MRLEPIEKPDSLFVRLAYAFTRRKIGKVITPAKVVYARVPASFKLGKAMAELPEKHFILDPELRLLIQTYIAGINKCAFCVDIAQAFAAKRKLNLDKFRALADYRTNALFSDAERAAIDYCREVTETRDASGATFERLRKHFDDRRIVEITMLNAIENYYNYVNRPLGIESDGLCLVPLPNPALGDRVGTAKQDIAYTN